jgi:transposase-like protein
MEKYPKSFQEFMDWFSTEEACQEYLFELRWPDGFLCPRCGGGGYWKMSRDIFRCTKCDFQASLTSGTVFQDTRKPLRVWFQAMWYLTNQKNGVSALGLQRVLGLGSYHTAWTWLHKLRHAMVRPGRDRLFGTVEVDETFIGGPKSGKRGRGAEGKALVLVAAQEDGKRIGRIRLKRVLDASGKTLEEAIMEMVSPGNIVRTDGWTGYGCLSKLGYNHKIARDESDVGENLLPLVHRVASLLKRWLLGTHQGAVRPTHLDYYLDEFTFRFNRRTSRSRGKLFYRLVQQSVSVGPLPASEIKGGRDE